MISAGIILWAIGFLITGGVFGYAKPTGAEVPETLCGMAMATLWPITWAFALSATTGQFLEERWR